MLVPGGSSRSWTGVESTESGMCSSRCRRARAHARLRLLPSTERRRPRRVGHHTLGEHQIRFEHLPIISRDVIKRLSQAEQKIISNNSV